MLDPVVMAAQNATDTLLLYYAGHGLVDRRGELHLTHVDSDPNPHRMYTAVPYDHIRDALLESRAARRIVILDCCYSGRALGQMGASVSAVVEEASAEGTYVLAAAAENKMALALPGEYYTAFTAELLDIINNGIMGLGPSLDLDSIYRRLLAVMKAKGRPLPQKRDRNTAGQMPLVRNQAYRNKQLQRRGLLLADRYELREVIGHGRMANVYRARDTRLDRFVAVKVLRDDLATDQLFQERFQREAQSAASLNHPSIIAVHDAGEDMVGAVLVPYVVMEYVDGRNLRELLKRDARLPTNRALNIIDEVLGALDYSHRHDIVHRDIKPTDIILSHAGEVKVGDFGIASVTNKALAEITATAEVLGAMRYLSPEQVRGELVDARSDLYSTGYVLYELLTGRPPFSGDSAETIVYQRIGQDPIPPSTLDPELPTWIDPIVLKALARNPAQRYQTASDMGLDIEQGLSRISDARTTSVERRRGSANRANHTGGAVSKAVVGQALYTWASHLLDGDRGFGISALSPSLHANLRWLRDAIGQLIHFVGTPSAYRRPTSVV
jgi:serine/threonine protein kinase